MDWIEVGSIVTTTGIVVEIVHQGGDDYNVCVEVDGRLIWLPASVLVPAPKKKKQQAE